MGVGLAERLLLGASGRDHGPRPLVAADRRAEAGLKVSINNFKAPYDLGPGEGLDVLKFGPTSEASASIAPLIRAAVKDRLCAFATGSTASIQPFKASCSSCVIDIVSASQEVSFRSRCQ